MTPKDNKILVCYFSSGLCTSKRCILKHSCSAGTRTVAAFVFKGRSAPVGGKLQSQESRAAGLRGYKKQRKMR